MPEKPHFPDTFATPQIVEEPFKYDLFKGHNRSDGSYKTDEQLRLEYLQLTDGLINKMTSGIQVTNPETGEKSIEKPDVVVWLDKSARPLSWFTKELWSKMATDPTTGEVPKMPDFRFVNIDREQWVNKLDPEGNGHMDIKRIDPTIIRSLRSIFVSPIAKRDGLTEKIDNAPSQFDGKTVMIVDEVYSSGRTLQYSQAFFERAFPTAKIGTAYWMSGITMKQGASGNKDLPVWYKQGDITGRGVGNRNDSLSAKSQNTTQRLGRYFLSTPLPGPDPNSLQLRKELHELATNPDVPVMPDLTRPDKLERIQSYNNGLSVTEVMKRVNEIKAQR
ncbi:MAG: hypothetical protein QFB86_03890 [Patescibacteria group bacterium]|nr:hypothetical protein [Patescibacteria group bacterium]